MRARLPDRKGTLCRLRAAGRLNSVLVEFGDGTFIVTSRYYLRRLPRL